MYHCAKKGQNCSFDNNFVKIINVHDYNRSNSFFQKCHPIANTMLIIDCRHFKQNLASIYPFSRRRSDRSRGTGCSLRPPRPQHVRPLRVPLVPGVGGGVQVRLAQGNGRGEDGRVGGAWGR